MESIGFIYLFKELQRREKKSALFFLSAFQKALIEHSCDITQRPKTGNECFDNSTFAKHFLNAVSDICNSNCLLRLTVSWIYLDISEH